MRPVACRGGADIHTGGQQPFADPVIAPGTLVHHPGYRMKITHRIGAGLDAVGTAHTALVIHQDKSVGRSEGGAHGANLDTGGLPAHVAEFGNKKGVPDLLLDIGPRILVPVQPPVGGIHVYLVGEAFDVAFHPGAVIAVRHVVFPFIRHTATAAA